MKILKNEIKKMQRLAKVIWVLPRVYRLTKKQLNEVIDIVWDDKEPKDVTVAWTEIGNHASNLKAVDDEYEFYYRHIFD